MGEDDSAMHYDEERIFKHLCFYLDSSSNARKLGMAVKTKKEEDLEKRCAIVSITAQIVVLILLASSFEEIANVIADNGGRIVDLDEPKLTHVVLDKRDISRRQELMKRTAK